MYDPHSRLQVELLAVPLGIEPFPSTRHIKSAYVRYKGKEHHLNSITDLMDNHTITIGHDGNLYIGGVYGYTIYSETIYKL